MLMMTLIMIQMDLFNFLKEDVNARSRPPAFVMEITNRLCDLIDDKHFTSANVNLCFQVAGSSKSEAHGKTPTTSNKTTSKSKSSKSGPASQLGGRILDSSFAAASATTAIQAENSGCAAGNCVGHYLIILLSLLTNAMYEMVRFTLHYCVAYN